jgi:hypothetical protein
MPARSQNQTNTHAHHVIRAQGLIGTAPSHQLLKIWNDREAALVEAGPEGTTLGGVLHTRPLGEWFPPLLTTHSTRSSKALSLTALSRPCATSAPLPHSIPKTHTVTMLI